MVIHLTEIEQQKIREYAEKFLKHKEGAGMKQGSASALEYDILGFTGEYIVHKQFGKPFQWEFDKVKRFDDIALLYKDTAVVCDVKSNYGGRELRIPKWQIDEDKDRGIDAYILVRVNKNFTSGEVIGVISKKRFKEIAKLKTYNTECYCVSDSDLSDISELC